MANKLNINNINEWLHSLGYFLPRNNVEEKRFNKLYSDFQYELDEDAIDPIKIINTLDVSGISMFDQKKVDNIYSLKHEKEWRLAARNKGNISENILNKMRHNQSNSKDETE